MEKRNEHLTWCKQRAIEYVEQKDMQQAFASFQSDMRKHPETAGHVALEMGTMLFFGGHLSNERQMREWINGFN